MNEHHRQAGWGWGLAVLSIVPVFKIALSSPTCKHLTLVLGYVLCLVETPRGQKVDVIGHICILHTYQNTWPWAQYIFN